MSDNETPCKQSGVSCVSGNLLVPGPDGSAGTFGGPKLARATRTVLSLPTPKRLPAQIDHDLDVMASM